MVRRSTLLLSATLGFGLLYLAATIALGSTPDAGDDGQGWPPGFATTTVTCGPGSGG